MAAEGHVAARRSGAMRLPATRYPYDRSGCAQVARAEAARRWQVSIGTQTFTWPLLRAVDAATVSRATRARRALPASRARADRHPHRRPVLAAGEPTANRAASIQAGEHRSLSVPAGSGRLPAIVDNFLYVLFDSDNAILGQAQNVAFRIAVAIVDKPAAARRRPPSNQDDAHGPLRASARQARRRRAVGADRARRAGGRGARRARGRRAQPDGPSGVFADSPRGSAREAMSDTGQPAEPGPGSSFTGLGSSPGNAERNLKVTWRLRRSSRVMPTLDRRRGQVDLARRRASTPATRCGCGCAVKLWSIAMLFAALVPVLLVASIAVGVILSSLEIGLREDADRQLTVGLNLILRAVERLGEVSVAARREKPDLPEPRSRKAVPSRSIAGTRTSRRTCRRRGCRSSTRRARSRSIAWSAVRSRGSSMPASSPAIRRSRPGKRGAAA